MSSERTVGVSFLLRVVLPDKPGSLGAVATALGNAGADILGVNVVERSPGNAVDGRSIHHIAAGMKHCRLPSYSFGAPAKRHGTNQ